MSSHNYEELFVQFPELAEPDALYEKEVLAHFGLLFSAYADLEAALQLCHIYTELFKSINLGQIENQETWKSEFDILEKKVFGATFGNLLKFVSNLDKFHPHLPLLKTLKEKRDYFAHHFFREENDKLHTNESRLFLIHKINMLRQEVNSTHDIIDEIQRAYLQQLYPQKDFDAYLKDELPRIVEAYKNNPPQQVGWEKP